MTVEEIKNRVMFQTNNDVDDMDEPALPVRFHPAIADWATWLVYRNGTPQKQQRGIPFRNAFEEMLASAIEDKSTDGSGGNNRVTHFTNIPR